MSANNKRGLDEATSWLWAGLWLLSVYVSIPLARAAQGWIQDRGWRDFFLWLTLGCFALAALWIGRGFMRGQFRFTGPRLAVLATCFGLFLWMTWSLRANPEEAFHFVQYGVLAVLVFRALRHRLGDPSIYLVTLGLGTAAGILDELIQWITPRRYFDFRDIGINAVSVLLVQAGMAFGIQPVPPLARPSRTGLRMAFGGAALGMFLMLFCVANTPSLKAWYTEFIPGAARLPDTTVEYGYRIEDPAIGVFFSRLPPDELRRQDQDEAIARDAAAFISHYRSSARYHEFIRRFPAHEHPLAVEARMHVFRRDRYAAGTRDPRHDAKTVAAHAFIADRENKILTTYFPNTLRQSIYAWNDETTQRIASLAAGEEPYVSAVSAHMFTRVSQGTVMGLFGGLLLLAIAGERWTAGHWRDDA